MGEEGRDRSGHGQRQSEWKLREMHALLYIYIKNKYKKSVLSYIFHTRLWFSFFFFFFFKSCYAILFLDIFPHFKLEIVSLADIREYMFGSNFK